MGKIFRVGQKGAFTVYPKSFRAILVTIRSS
nr:MAG TPA: hypothetical protein [Caudoviricetes sp.]